jgi:hypothetical protein
MGYKQGKKEDVEERKRGKMKAEDDRGKGWRVRRRDGSVEATEARMLVVVVSLVVRWKEGILGFSCQISVQGPRIPRCSAIC